MTIGRIGWDTAPRMHQRVPAVDALFPDLYFFV